MESVFDSLRIPVDNSLANNSLTSSWPRWLSGYECGRPPREKYQYSMRLNVNIKNLPQLLSHIWQHIFPYVFYYFFFFFNFFLHLFFTFVFFTVFYFKLFIHCLLHIYFLTYFFPFNNFLCNASFLKCSLCSQPCKETSTGYCLLKHSILSFYPWIFHQDQCTSIIYDLLQDFY